MVTNDLLVVAWRQLEQTFDAAIWSLHQIALSMDYAYSWRINTVFGPDSPNGQLDGDFHLFRTDYKVTGNQTVPPLLICLITTIRSAIAATPMA